MSQGKPRKKALRQPDYDKVPPDIMFEQDIIERPWEYEERDTTPGPARRRVMNDRNAPKKPNKPVIRPKSLVPEDAEDQWLDMGPNGTGPVPNDDPDEARKNDRRIMKMSQAQFDRKMAKLGAKSHRS